MTWLCAPYCINISNDYQECELPEHRNSPHIFLASIVLLYSSKEQKCLIMSIDDVGQTERAAADSIRNKLKEWSFFPLFATPLVRKWLLVFCIVDTAKFDRILIINTPNRWLLISLNNLPT